MQIFQSRHHPGDAPRALVWARAFVTPLATCMLPVMIGTLMAALEGFSVLPYLWMGFPGAIVAAVLWTLLRLRRIFAELTVTDGRAALHTVAEVLRPGYRPDLLPVLDLRKTDDGLTVALGLASYDLYDADWPDATAMLAALQEARHQMRYATHST